MHAKYGANRFYERRVMAEIRFDIFLKFWLKLLSDPHVLEAINLGDRIPTLLLPQALLLEESANVIFGNMQLGPRAHFFCNMQLGPPK